MEPDILGTVNSIDGSMEVRRPSRLGYEKQGYEKENTGTRSPEKKRGRGEERFMRTLSGRVWEGTL